MSAIIALWKSLGVKWDWDFKRSETPITIGPGREHIILDTEEIEGVFFPSSAIFNSPYCGIRFKTDKYDSRYLFSAYNLYANGAVSPNHSLYCPKFDTTNNIYVVATDGHWPFEEKFVFSLFNSGSTAAQCLSFAMWYCYAKKSDVIKALQK